jgi:hypothetical protein
VRVIDLLDEFDRAERRPIPGVEAPAHLVGGIARPAIVMPVPSRVTWSVPLPRRGLLRTHVVLTQAAAGQPASPAGVRIGISDDRIYETLLQTIVTPDQNRWMDLTADLSAYAGWKWSLFYRPDRVTWRIVLAADAGGGGPAFVVWGSPEIVTDNVAAKEYAERRRRMHAARRE